MWNLCQRVRQLAIMYHLDELASSFLIEISYRMCTFVPPAAAFSCVNLGQVCERSDQGALIAFLTGEVSLNNHSDLRNLDSGSKSRPNFKRATQSAGVIACRKYSSGEAVVVYLGTLVLQTHYECG